MHGGLSWSDAVYIYIPGNEGDHYPGNFDTAGGNAAWSMETYTAKYLVRLPSAPIPAHSPR